MTSICQSGSLNYNVQLKNRYFIHSILSGIKYFKGLKTLWCENSGEVSYSVGHVFTFTGQRSVFVAFICYMHVIQGEKSVPLSLSFTMRGAQRLNDKRGIVGTVMLWSLWVYVLWQGYREKHGSLGSFYIDSSLTRTAVLCRNDNSIHHLTGHLYRQGRSAVQDSFARANYVCM